MTLYRIEWDGGAGLWHLPEKLERLKAMVDEMRVEPDNTPAVYRIAEIDSTRLSKMQIWTDCTPAVMDALR